MGLTEEGEGVKDIHAEKSGETEFEKIHDGFQGPCYCARFCDEVLEIGDFDFCA